MYLKRLIFAGFLLTLGYTAQAQINNLPETATGARALPAAHVEISWWGAMFWGQIGNTSTRTYIWGEAGEQIDSLLNDLGIDIQGDAGVLYYTVLFEISGLGITAPISVTGEIDKLAGEDLEEAFERNYAEGDLSNPLGQQPQNFTAGTSGGGLDVGSLGSNSYYTPYGYVGISYPTRKKTMYTVTITDLN